MSSFKQILFCIVVCVGVGWGGGVAYIRKTLGAF